MLNCKSYLAVGLAATLAGSAVAADLVAAPGTGIRIHSYSVERERGPVQRSAGAAAVQGTVYRIRLNGDFDINGAYTPRLYVGDTAITEFGGTRGGVYFKVYSDSALKALQGKSFGYQDPASGRRVTTGLKFYAQGVSR